MRKWTDVRNGKWKMELEGGRERDQPHCMYPGIWIQKMD
jgi:hypothetical protein